MNRRRCPFSTTPSSQRHLCALRVSSLSSSDLFLSPINSKLSTIGSLLLLSRHSSHQYHSKRFTLPLFSYSYPLFCILENSIFNPHNAFRTLCAKHPGWGTPNLKKEHLRSASSESQRP